MGMATPPSIPPPNGSSYGPPPVVGCNPEALKSQVAWSFADQSRASAAAQAATVILGTLPPGAVLFMEIHKGGLLTLPGSPTAPGSPDEYLIVMRTPAIASMALQKRG